MSELTAEQKWKMMLAEAGQTVPISTKKQIHKLKGLSKEKKTLLW